MVYWPPNDEKRLRLLRLLGEEPAKQQSEPEVPEELMPPDTKTDETALLLGKILDTLKSNTAETQALRDALQEQKAVLDNLNNKPKVVERSMEHPPVAPHIPAKKKGISLDDIKVDVLDTSGIEIGSGQAGGEVKKGENISDRVKKLKLMRGQKDG